MNKRKNKLFLTTIAVCIVFLFIGTTAFSEPLDLKQIVSTLLEQDENLQIVSASAEAARQQAEIVKGRSLPQLAFSTDPLYSFGLRRDYSFDTFPPENRTTLSNNFNAGIGLTQQLGTGGVITVSLDETFQYIVQLAENSLDQTNTFAHQPVLNFTYTQPLFVNGKLIDGELMKAAHKAADLAYLSLEKNIRGTKNRTILTAAGLYIQLLSLKRNRDFLTESLKLAEDQLAQITIDKEQGRASENQVLGLEVAVNRQKEAILDIELALVEAAEQLSNLTNQQIDPEILSQEDVAPLLLQADRYAEEQDLYNSLEKFLTDNPEIQARQIDREIKKFQSISNDNQNTANMNLFFNISPRYPDERAAPGNFGNSFTDFFAEGAGININAGLAFNIPITDGGQRASRRKADAVQEQIAALQLASTEQQVRQSIAIGEQKNEILRKRLALLAVDIEYQQKRVQREEKLASLNTSTGVNVQTIKLDLLRSENNLWQTKAELFLNSLELAALLGEPLEKIILP